MPRGSGGVKVAVRDNIFQTRITIDRSYQEYVENIFITIS